MALSCAALWLRTPGTNLLGLKTVDWSVHPGVETQFDALTTCFKASTMSACRSRPSSTSRAPRAAPAVLQRPAQPEADCCGRFSVWHALAFVAFCALCYLIASYSNLGRHAVAHGTHRLGLAQASSARAPLAPAAQQRPIPALTITALRAAAAQHAAHARSSSNNASQERPAATSLQHVVSEHVARMAVPSPPQPTLRASSMQHAAPHMQSVWNASSLLVAHVPANPGSTEALARRSDAVIVILARNREASSLQATLREFEARFNHGYHYPYVFLNDERFDDHFIAAQRAAAPASEMFFGLVCLASIGMGSARHRHIRS